MSDIIIPAGLAGAAGLVVGLVVKTLQAQKATDERYMTRTDCKQAHDLCGAHCEKCKMERDEYARHQARDMAAAGVLERAALQRELGDIKTALAGIAATQRENAEMTQHLMRLLEERSHTPIPIGG